MGMFELVPDTFFYPVLSNLFLVHMAFDEFIGGQILISAVTTEEKAERRDTGWALDETYWEDLGRQYGNEALTVIRDARHKLEPQFGAAMFSGEFEVIVEPTGMVGLQMADAASPHRSPITMHYGHLNASQPEFCQRFISRVQNDFAKRVIAASQDQYEKHK